MRKIFLLAALVLGAAGTASAQTSAGQDLVLDVDQVLRISAVGTTVNFAGNNAAFTTGYASQAASIDFSGNVAHEVSVQADEATMSGTGGARANKPASDVSVQADGQGGHTSLSHLSGTTLASRAAGDWSLDLDYRINLDYSLDTAGTYTLGVTYTIVAAEPEI